MDDYAQRRPFLRDALAAADRREQEHADNTATQAATAIERSLFAGEDTVTVTQLAQRRADAINCVIRAKEHTQGGSPVFSAHDAATAYDIALLLNGVAEAAVEAHHPAFADSPVPSKPVAASITRAITLAQAAVIPDRSVTDSEHTKE
jgi:hypothetical protein